jgi:hypothetical protein
MKLLWWCVLLLVTVACRGDGGDLDDVAVELAVTPDPPAIGPATVVVNLSDDEGHPLTGATMSLEGNMSHAGMVPVLAQASEVSPGIYIASLEFTMAGDWFFLVKATLADGRTLEHREDLLGVDVFCGTPLP